MNKPIARRGNIVIQKLDGETLVYDLKENKAFCLNETSALAWELCDGTRTPLEMSDEMSGRLKTLVGENFINLALDQLSKDGLLENGGGNYLEGVSRRELIRKVGFGSVVALPVISSLVAPTALMAQSVCMPGAGGIESACANDSDCNSCNCMGIIPGTPNPACCIAGLTGNPFGDAIRSGSQIGPAGGNSCISAAECTTLGAQVCCSGNGALGPNVSCPSTMGCFCS